MLLIYVTVVVVLDPISVDPDLIIAVWTVVHGGIGAIVGASVYRLGNRRGEHGAAAAAGAISVWLAWAALALFFLLAAART